jgi:hypothetical protein
MMIDRIESAIAALLRADEYEVGVQPAAEESSARSCTTSRWQDSWLTYKAEADEHEPEF